MWEKAQWVVGDASRLWKVHEGKSWLSIYVLLKSLESVLRGFAQVCFANNSWTGLLILIGVSLQNPYVGLASFFSCCTALLMSKILNQPDNLVVSGLLIYSASLVGTVTIALFPSFFAEPLSAQVWCAIFIMGSLTVCVSIGLDAIFEPVNLPVYTLPFNITISLLFLIFQSAGFERAVIPPPVNITSHVSIEWGRLLEGTLKSAGQVYAVEDDFCSALIVLGLFINSPFLAIMSVIGGFLSSLVGLMITQPPYTTIYAGIWGYNGFLASGCLAFFVYPTPISIFLAFLNAIFSTCIQCGLGPTFAVNNLPVLTFPFCMSSLIFVALIPSIPGLERVTVFTYPEDHFLKKRREIKAAQRVAVGSQDATNQTSLIESK